MTNHPPIAGFASGNPPTLKEYTELHSMLCRPSTANRTLKSFDDKIVFLPYDYSQSQQEIRSADLTPLFTFKTTLLGYYLMVLLSLTGFSTLFKQTKFLVAREESGKEIPRDAVLSGVHDKKLQVHPCVLDYIKNQTGSKSLTFKRRFEFHFGGLVKLSVMMLHIQSEKGLSLVEVYRFENSTLELVAGGLQRIYNILPGLFNTNNEKNE